MEGLRGGLFGFRRKDVRQILADRERMYEEAIHQTQLAEERLRDVGSQIEPLRAQVGQAKERAARAEDERRELQTEIGSVRDHLSLREKETDVLRGQVAELRSSLDELRHELQLARQDPLSYLQSTGDLPVKFLIAEIAPIIKAAEESAGRLIEDARRNADERAAEVARMRDEVRLHLEEMVSWRAMVEPMMEGVRARMSETRLRIEEVPDRIHEALAPVASFIGELSAQLERFAMVARPPELSHPAGDVIQVEGSEPAEPLLILENSAQPTTAEGGERGDDHRERDDLHPGGHPAVAGSNGSEAGGSHLDSRILAAVPPTLRRYWLPQVGSGRRSAR